MRSIEGRVTDMIVTSDGRYIPGEFFPHLFKDVKKSVKEFQATQEARNKLVINLVKGNNYSQKDLDYIMRNIREYVGEGFEIDVCFCRFHRSHDIWKKKTCDFKGVNKVLRSQNRAFLRAKGKA